MPAMHVLRSFAGDALEHAEVPEVPQLPGRGTVDAQTHGRVGRCLIQGGGLANREPLRGKRGEEVPQTVFQRPNECAVENLLLGVSETLRWYLYVFHNYLVRAHHDTHNFPRVPTSSNGAFLLQY